MATKSIKNENQQRAATPARPQAVGQQKDANRSAKVKDVHGKRERTTISFSSQGSAC